MRRGTPITTSASFTITAETSPIPTKRSNGRLEGFCERPRIHRARVIERARPVQGGREEKQRKEEEQRRCRGGHGRLGAPDGQNPEGDRCDSSRDQERPDGGTAMGYLPGDHRAEHSSEDERGDRVRRCRSPVEGRFLAYLEGDGLRGRPRPSGRCQSRREDRGGGDSFGCLRTIR